MRIAIVTSFPEDGTNKSGIAYFAKTVLDPLVGGPDEFVILADKSGDERSTTERYASNVTVRRCWKFGYFAPFQILREALRHRFDVLHLEYDVYLYGGVVAAVILPFVLRLIAMLRGAQIVTTLHGVVSQRVVTREMLRENGFVLPYSRIGKLGFYTIYSLFNWACDRIIVLEIKLGEILESEYGVPRRKLFVCPHPLMYENVRPSMAEARARCGISEGRMALFFGYASYYKGLDVLLDAVEIARRDLPDLQLHLVASRHPRLQGSSRYEEFYRAFEAKTATAGAHLYDFVPEEKLADLLAASDVVVLPYTAAYGASGALNAVFAARRPVLVSHYVRFDGAIDSQVFDPTPQDCARAIVNFFETDEALLEARVEEIARLRNVGVIAGTMQDVRCGRVPAGLASAPLPPQELAEVAVSRVEP